MKNLKKIALLTLAATVFATSFTLPQTAKADDAIVNMVSADDMPIYRLYNPDNGEHLYTTDANECSELYSHHGWGYEGIAWFSSNEGTPVYRLYNNVLCNHLYTTDTNEIKVLTSMKDTAWTIDNNGQPLFYSSGEVLVYRVYNEELQGMHHLTTDFNEYSTLPDYGWKQEGVSLYATAIGSPKNKTAYYTSESASESAPSQNLCPYPLWTWIDFGDGIVGYYEPGNEDYDTYHAHVVQMNATVDANGYKSYSMDIVGCYDDTYTTVLTKYTTN